MEEYPEAVKDIYQTKSDDRWILETDVYNMVGLGRFYMGLEKQQLHSISILEIMSHMGKSLECRGRGDWLANFRSMIPKSEYKVIERKVKKEKESRITQEDTCCALVQPNSVRLH